MTEEKAKLELELTVSRARIDHWRLQIDGLKKELLSLADQCVEYGKNLHRERMTELKISRKLRELEGDLH